MSGHSKWHNIQKTKGAQDAKRAAAFTKIAKEMYVAVKEGGGSTDPSYNSRLATVITKAKAANMPNDNIKRVLEKAANAGSGDSYESITYEGYGPSGIAVIVETMTDSRNRTAGNVRHHFDKYGGKMGAAGCVSWNFSKKGVLVIDNDNPYYDNGIKLIDCYGEKMPEEILLLVEDYIDGKLHVFDKDWPELPFAHREHIGCTVDYVSGRNRYMGYLISLGIYSFKGVKVGLDCANGSSWNIAKSVFDALGADTYVINAQPNGTNINNNAGSTHIEGLQKFVVEKGLDIGFAYDGDADRCLCVDEMGNVITGDHILYIYGCYMKERGKLLTNTVVTTVMSNFGLYKAFDEQGIGYAKTAVGDKYVYEYMAKNGCRIGGEQSGHIIFSKYASTGDGILTSLKMMEVMLAKKLPMSKLAEPLKIYPQVLENVRVTDKKAAQNDPAVQEAVKAVAEALGDTGRILVRESGTEPLVRVMVEAPDHDTCQRYVSQVVEVIKNKGYAV